jgi:signal transduction histidine kinase/pSer/pThr/pTyr-binding forkhead associated (FHA) protein
VPRLLVIKGADEGKQFELSEGLLGVGRDASNPIRLHDTEVSRRHAEFFGTEDGFMVRDVGSANGTYVNGQKVGQKPLQTGDRIQIGQTVLAFITGRGETAQAKNDLADQINLISRHDLELSSAIIKTIAASEGSQILAHPEKAKTPWLKTALANLSIMYEASNAVSHILDLNELLNRMLELIARSIPADRGCIMVQAQDSGELEPVAVRWQNKSESVQKMMVSRTIIDHVLREKEGILVSDAAQDERFSTGQSIVRFGIREVICVPMKGRHETLGVFYLDTRSTPQEMTAQRASSLAKFSEDHLSLTIALAHQAALAVEESRYHKAMVQAERLAAIGQTVAHLSHAIRNILQGLRSGSEILKMGITEKDDTLLNKGWRIVEKNQGKIYDLVMDMLSYSKEREPNIEETDLNDLAKDLFELVSPRAAEKNIKFDISVEEDLPPVQVDPEGIHKALLNIVGNALDAVDGRSNPQVAMGTRRDSEAGWVRLVVLDNGAGIPEEKIKDIFKPFVSTKGAKGTGLGLPVSRKILREHGGDIVVQSQAGKGSKFILRFPIKSPLLMDLSATGEDVPVLPPEPE